MAWLARATGTIAANGQSVALDVQEQATALIEVTGTWVGTLAFEYTTDNANWYPLPAVTLDTGVAATSESVNGIWRADVSAAYTMRARASAWTSGAAALYITASDVAARGGVQAVNPSAAAIVAATSPPAATNAGSDTVVTFPSQMRHLDLQNKTAANVYYAFDAAASLGSFVLYPQQELIKDVLFTVLHLFTAAAQNINGSADLNIVMEARS